MVPCTLHVVGCTGSLAWFPGCFWDRCSGCLDAGRSRSRCRGSWRFLCFVWVCRLSCLLWLCGWLVLLRLNQIRHLNQRRILQGSAAVPTDPDTMLSIPPGTLLFAADFAIAEEGIPLLLLPVPKLVGRAGLRPDFACSFVWADQDPQRGHHRKKPAISANTWPLALHRKHLTADYCSASYPYQTRSPALEACLDRILSSSPLILSKIEIYQNICLK